MDPILQIGGRDAGGGGKNGADVVEMFLGPAFAEEEQLADDDGCRWRKPIGAIWGFDLLAVLQFPKGEFAFAGQIAVRAQRAVMVDDVEMAAGFPGDFGKQHFRGGKIKIPGWEGFDECRHMNGRKRDDDIGVEGQAGPAIGDRGESSNQTIANGCCFEGEGQEVKLLHGR